MTQQPSDPPPQQPQTAEHGGTSAGPPAQPAVPPPQAQSQERTWGMLCHLLALAGFVVPFGNIIGPLVIWLVKREEMPVVDDQGKESLNFQITMTIAYLICIPLAFVMVGFFLAAAIGIFNLVMVIIATVRANAGEWYRYPFALRLIS